jgi:hypothetical protein
MPDNDMEKNNPIFDELLKAAKEENWNFVDEKIKNFDITHEIVDWTLETGLFDKDNNIRDFAATILDNSEIVLTKSDIEKIKDIMLKDEYDVVQYRLAIALYRAGDESPEVEEMVQKAKDDPNVGELAKTYLNN